MAHAMSLENSSDAATFEVFANSESQNRQILEYLFNGGVIDPHIAREKFGCERLASRIFDLRELGKEMGFKIITYKMEYTDRRGKKRRYARYALEGGGGRG